MNDAGLIGVLKPKNIFGFFIFIYILPFFKQKQLQVGKENYNLRESSHLSFVEVFKDNRYINFGPLIIPTTPHYDSSALMDVDHNTPAKSL